jgi:CDP-diacylglycerol--glycerol-3-phosphate 3-phosphatidyltransferase
MTDRHYIDAFEGGRIAPSDFHHADHLRLALAYLTESGSVQEATDRMAASLKAFARSAGHEEKYHHTLTVVWLRLVARLLDKQLPLAHYSHDRLFGAEARERWIEPDVRPL